MIFSEINTILPGNWTDIEPPDNTPVVGAWRERQETVFAGLDTTTHFIIEVYTDTGWISKMVLTQD